MSNNTIYAQYSSRSRYTALVPVAVIDQV